MRQRRYRNPKAVMYTLIFGILALLVACGVAAKPTPVPKAPAAPGAPKAPVVVPVVPAPATRQTGSGFSVSCVTFTCGAAKLSLSPYTLRG